MPVLDQPEYNLRSSQQRRSPKTAKQAVVVKNNKRCHMLDSHYDKYAMPGKVQLLKEESQLILHVRETSGNVLPTRGFFFQIFLLFYFFPQGNGRKQAKKSKFSNSMKANQILVLHYRTAIHNRYIGSWQQECA